MNANNMTTKQKIQFYLVILEDLVKTLENTDKELYEKVFSTVMDKCEPSVKELYFLIKEAVDNFDMIEDIKEYINEKEV